MNASSFNSEFDSVAETAESAMALMTAQRVPPTPDNFQVWFEYCRGESPYLQKTIDALLASGRRFDAAVNRDLFLTHASSSTRDREDAHELSRQIQHLADRAREMLNAAAADQRNQARDLVEVTAQVGSHADGGGPCSVVERLVEELTKAAARASSLESSFAKTSDEIGKIRESLETAEKESNTDVLTGLANRRALDAFLRATRMAALGSGEPLSLLLVDVDHFKQFNDGFGHLIGDQVLRLIARTAQDNVRASDLVARYGGEELMAVLPSADSEICGEIAERIRRRLAESQLVRRSTGEKLPPVTVSIGVAQFIPGEAIEALIARCDEALYAAKRAGRNRIVVALSR
ncbi:GGDEF domain-containing protein [Bradyrhizobium sp. WD16]|uniref:GGDEF domain-containing protein n=1 Tax=Bradyrhizobium sp. WD16 TaxID=1521768 RepID=UPI0020A4B4BF|nr:GGDEF domain-containing protein [Bradyrhizobium sp. WD16]UTD27645.1 GGDEF domain-containing protein [Bradyrhizobium sp. WD16]